jgi:cytochrome c biogenesis protein
MTDVRVPETDPFESAAPERGGRGPASPATGSFGTGDWLKWAWRQLTSMRIALVLLFLLALGSVPGSILPQEGTDAAGVQQYFTSHPSLAPLLSHLGLFDVFGAPWFASIYLLLFVSLVGCVVPRTFRLAGSTRTLPPQAPRNLARLPASAEYGTALSPAQAAEVAARVLSGHGFRLRRPAPTLPAGSAAPTGPAGSAAPTGPAGSGYWVSAEKGYLREVGNLLFHLALLGVLVAIALGGLFGYKADRLLVQGTSFADTPTDLDEFYPGRLVTAADLPPFSITLNTFDASYITSGAQRGQPNSFDAQISYTASPGGPVRTDRLEVNRPLSVDGAKVYLIGHGYAPEFKVTDARGQVVFDGAQPFISGTTGNFLSQGVLKVTGAEPEQLGFSGVFVPTAVDVNGTLESVFPAADNPVVSLIAYAGNLGMNSGPAQSVYQMDTAGMKQLTAAPQLLQIGQSLKLPDGQGTITFTGYQQWVSLAVTHDPGQLPALICGMAALGGLLLSFVVRRRRVFVRASTGPQGTTVHVGGLARTDASGAFEDEFASLAAELRSAHQQAAQDPSAQDPPAQAQAAQDQAAQDETAQDCTAQDQAARDETAYDQTGQNQAAQDRPAQDQTGQNQTAQSPGQAAPVRHEGE